MTINVTPLGARDADENETEAREGPASQMRGFMGRLQGASLFDLVQFECLAGTRHVVRVISSDRVGYLFFDGGNVVHARARGLEGDAAALELLGWKDGLFEPCSVPWPKVNTITKQWQYLLLLAAKASDETQRIDEGWVGPEEEVGGKVLEFPNDRAAEQSALHAAVGNQRGHTVSKEPSSSDRMSNVGTAVTTGVSASGRPPAPTPVSSKPPEVANTVPRAAVRLDLHGNVLTSRGDGEALVGPILYALRVGHLVADALGLGAVTELECESAQHRVLVHCESDGQITAVKAGHDVNMGRIKEKIGL